MLLINGFFYVITDQSEFHKVVGRGAGDAYELGIFLDRYETERQNIALGIRPAVFRIAVDQDAVFRTELKSHRIYPQNKKFI